MTRSASIGLPVKWTAAAVAATIAGCAATPGAAAAAPATSEPPTIRAGVFQIQNWGGDYRCLTASPLGGPVTTAECAWDAENQLFWRTDENEFVPWQGAVGPFYCLSADAGNVVSLPLCSGAPQHIWTQPNETLTNNSTGRCLTAEPGDRVGTAPCTGAASQKWRLFGN